MKKSDINVLVVDDDQTIGKTLSEAISRAGYKATLVHRADDALNAARLKHFHAAVVDCMLPVKNGITLSEEIRKTRFDNGTIVLMSGVFRDKIFEAEAVHKTGAIAYLQKPFGPAELLASLKPSLDALIVNQQLTLQTILVRKLESVRDRLKIVEHLEEIRGIEMVFVLSILIDAKVSGFVNLATETGSIYGISLHDGKLLAVDSDNGDQVVIKFLTDTGYLSHDDLAEFNSKEQPRNPLQKLVSAGYISPHAANQARHDQMAHELAQILKTEKLNISFVPEELKPTEDGMDLLSLFTELNDTIESLLDVKYISYFFQDFMDSMTKPLEYYNEKHPVWGLPLVKRMKIWLGGLRQNMTVNTLVSQDPLAKTEILRAVYCLVLFRQILFVDADAVKSSEQEAIRRQKVYEAIVSLTPMETFMYFGASSKVTIAEVSNVFKEFVKSNHPDRLPPDAPKALRDVTNGIFGLVSNAYDILSDPAKRDAYNARIQAEKANDQLRAETLGSEAAELIRRGAYAKAVEKATQAMNIHPSSEIFMLHAWARVKQGGKIPKSELQDIQKRLEEIQTKERLNAQVYMVLGLVRAANGDVQAINSFERALALNPNFVEARREINRLQGREKGSGVTSASDILTGDITQIVSSIFKKKKAK